MIPIQTAVPSRYPPVITWMLIATNCVVFLFQTGMSTWELNRFLFRFALIPARYFELVAYGNLDLKPDDLLPFITMMFLHAGWLHIIFNMWTLWLFGPRLEQAWGQRSFSFYYLLCGLGGWLADLLIVHNGTPLLGASAAIFGVMLAYAMRWPDDVIDEEKRASLNFWTRSGRLTIPGRATTKLVPITLAVYI